MTNYNWSLPASAVAQPDLLERLQRWGTAAPAGSYSTALPASPVAQPSLLERLQQWGTAAPVVSSQPNSVLPAPFELSATTGGGYTSPGGLWERLSNFVGKIFDKENFGGYNPETKEIMPNRFGTIANTGLGLLNSFLGWKQYGMAKEALRNAREQFALNYDAQRNLLNAQLEDRQRARLAANPNAYESLSSYMERFGIRER